VSHNGLEFLYEFRSYPDWQDVPVLLLTNVSPGTFAASWQLLTGQLGVRSYLYKPRTSLKKFVHAVGDVLSASRAR
jgi:CheY-like chemotaxis protein